MNTESALVDIPDILPHETIYQIQIGTKVFKISGASLSSDGPSFFTDFFRFRDSLDVTLTIDRSDDVFQLIVSYLQGYPLTIADETEFITVYLDSLYYRLPKLTRTLQNYEYYFMNIGGTHFKFSKILFERPGDSPNYFNLLLDSMLMDLENIFTEKKLLRPPSHFVPYVTRSSILFQEILNLLADEDYVVPAHIPVKNLLKECRFYCLLNLQQRLIPHKITINPFCNREELTISLQHVKRSGIKTVAQSATDLEHCEIRDSDSDDSSDSPCKKRKLSCIDWNMVSYQRPYIDKNPRDLIFQFESGDLTVFFNKRLKKIHVNVASQSDCTMLRNIFADVIKTNQIDESQFIYQNFKGYVFSACVPVADLTINGLPCKNICSKVDELKTNAQIYDFTNGDGFMPGLKLHVVGPSLWRIGIKPTGLMMIALKLNCITNLKQLHKSLEFI